MPVLAHAPVSLTIVEIGGIAVRLHSSCANFHDLVEDRYRQFLAVADAESSLDLLVNAFPSDESAIDDIHLSRRRDSWLADRGDFHIEWNPATRFGTLDLPLKAYSLDAALRVLHTLVLAEQRGFLLHAASAIRSGRSHLFFGPSGVGKTTIARLAPPDATLLTDEISYLRYVGQRYCAYGTPFTGELAKLGENTSAPIAALYRLTKASTNRLTLMSQSDSARALLENILFFAEDPKLVKLVFDTACDLVSQVPVYQLEFAPDLFVWDLVS